MTLRPPAVALLEVYSLGAALVVKMMHFQPTRLIEQGFVGELKGQAHLAYEPSGVVCKLDIPLAALVPARPTDTVVQQQGSPAAS